jgi:hypothetical protein
VKKIVTKDWSDPPSVTPSLTPEVSGSSLAAVLVKLQKSTSRGTGGGNLDTGTNGELKRRPCNNGKSLYDRVEGKFFMTLVKWKEYDTMTAGQKKAWDDMIVLDGTRNGTRHDCLPQPQNSSRRSPGLDVTLAAEIADAQTADQPDQDDFDSATKTDHGKNDWTTFKKVVLDTSADPPPKTPTPAKT